MKARDFYNQSSHIIKKYIFAVLMVCLSGLKKLGGLIQIRTVVHEGWGFNFLLHKLSYLPHGKIPEGSVLQKQHFSSPGGGRSLSSTLLPSWFQSSGRGKCYSLLKGRGQSDYRCPPDLYLYNSKLTPSLEGRRELHFSQITFPEKELRRS